MAVELPDGYKPKLKRGIHESSGSSNTSVKSLPLGVKS